MPGDTLSPRAWAVAVALVVVMSVAAALRVRHATRGLPDFPYPDELSHFVELAERAEGSNFRDTRPVTYAYPPGYALSLALVLRGARSTGVLDCDRGLAGLTGERCAVLVGRLWTAALGILTVALVYLASSGWQTPLGRLVSAATLAVAPFHVLDSHLANPDIPMTFWVSVSLACSIRAATGFGWLAAAAFFAGLAAATKYPGIFALGPALVAVANRLRTARRRDAVVAAALVSTAAAAGILVGCPRCIADAAEIIRDQRFQARLQMLRGWPGIDLYPGAILAHRYLYQLGAVLPFSLGWGLYALAILGIVALLRSPSWPRTVLAAFGVPFLLFMGASRVSPPRYFLPLVPPLALCVGCTLGPWCTRWRPRLTRALVGAAIALSLGYSCVLSASLVEQADFRPQREAAAWLAARARTSPQPLTVGYPDRWLWYYDGAAALISPGALQWRFMPMPRGGQAPDYGPWLAVARPDLMLWPSFMEIRARRNYPDSAASRFLDDLDGSRLGYRLAAAFPTRYFSEPWYTMLDPTFATQWELGIVGYRIFERVAADREGEVVPGYHR